MLYMVVEPSRFEVWIQAWADLVEFGVVPVQTSAEAAQAVAAGECRLDGSLF